MSYARITSALSAASGHPFAFLLALAVVAVWAALGPFLHFSETWQLVINTGTTIITFLMVFVIQSSQNRDTRALQIKLDELIRINSDARNALLDLENRPEAELAQIQREYRNLAKQSAESGSVERSAPKASRRARGSR